MRPGRLRLEGTMKFFATAAWGTEAALRDELRELRTPRVRCDRGGVNFEGHWEHAWKVCLHSRIALRVLLPLQEFFSPDADALYDGVRSVDWSEHLSPEHSLAVTASCRDSVLTHTNFVAQKVKDAVVDQQRDKAGERSSVDRHDPDLHIFLHLKKNRATVYLDLAGDSLHKRGYRKKTSKAPLKESLAAAILRLSKWDRRRPFVDPMCGSGTIAIEAALWSRRVVPGLSRERFGFERWPNHDESAKNKMAELREQAQAQALTEGPDIFASDVDPEAIDAAFRNAQAAGAQVEVTQASVFDLKPLGPAGMIVTNPPYGKQIDTDAEFYTRLGQTFQKLKNHRIGILLADRKFERAMGLEQERYQLLFNGDIQCSLGSYEIE